MLDEGAGLGREHSRIFMNCGQHSNCCIPTLAGKGRGIKE